MYLSVVYCSTIGQGVSKCGLLFYHWSGCILVWFTVLPLVRVYLSVVYCSTIGQDVSKCGLLF